MPAAAKENALPRLARGLALAAVLLAATACTSGGKRESPATTAARAAPAPAPLRIDLRASATGAKRAADAKRAAKQVSPALQRFLQRYLQAAFLQAPGGRSGWNDLLALFDPPVKAAARTQLDALSLGGDAAKVTAVRPGRTVARALLLLDGGRPVAATVRLSFDGTADTAQGSGPVHLRSAFHLLQTGGGWRIAAFSSRTGPSS